MQAGAGALADAQAARRAALFDPSRITVVTCGTGSPIPSTRAQSCLAVFVNGQFLLFDAGDRAQAAMEDINLPVTELDAVFITHFHSDHIADLGEVLSRTWILGRENPLTVYGGAGIDQVVEGFNAVYTADDAYRTAHHGEDLFPVGLRPAIASVIEDASVSGTVVYENDGVRVLADTVDHSPVAVALGYRVEYMGRAVGISGDTIDTPGLAALATNADILVSEVMNKAAVEDFECAFGAITNERLARIFRDIRTYHIDVSELAQLAEDADVTTLVLTHMVPNAASAPQANALFRTPTEALYSGTVALAEDGMEWVLEVQ